MELISALQEYVPRSVSISSEYSHPWVHQLNVRLTPSDDTFKDPLKSRIILSIGDAIDPMKSVKDTTNNFVLEVIPRIKSALQTIEGSKLTRFYLTGDYNLTAVGAFTDTVLITYIKTLTEGDGFTTNKSDGILYNTYEQCCEEYFKKEEGIECVRTKSGLIIRDSSQKAQIKVFFCNDELAPKDGDLVLRLNETLERIRTSTKNDLKLTRPAIAEFYAVYRKYLPPEWCGFIRFCKYWAAIHLFTVPDNFPSFLEVCCVKVLIRMSEDTNTNSRSIDFVEAFCKVIETSFNKDLMKEVNSILIPLHAFDHEMTHSENYARYGRQPQVQVDWRQFNDDKIEFCGLMDRGLDLFDESISTAWKHIGISAKRIVKKRIDTGEVTIGEIFLEAISGEAQRKHRSRRRLLSSTSFSFMLMFLMFTSSSFFAFLTLMYYVEGDGTLASPKINDTVIHIENNFVGATKWLLNHRYTEGLVESPIYEKIEEGVGSVLDTFGKLPVYWKRVVPDSIRINLGAYRNFSWKLSSIVYSRINLWFVALSSLKSGPTTHTTNFGIGDEVKAVDVDRDSNPPSYIDELVEQILKNEGGGGFVDEELVEGTKMEYDN